MYLLVLLLLLQNFHYRRAHEDIQHHQKVSGVTYVCTLCSKTYQTRHYLNMHINNVHKTKRFKCDGCSRTYQFKYELVRHLPKYVLYVSTCYEYK